MSIPSTARRPDPSSPPARGVTDFVCPKCHRRFNEAEARGVSSQCPDDRTALIRVRDLAEAHGDPMLGRVLDGRFTILARLGAGSMGTVYRAKQQAIGREVAVKILRSDRAVDAASKGRFLREARANSLLTSSNTVTVFDFGQSDTGELYLAMELLEGESLGQRLKRDGRLTIDATVETAKQALRSLAEAHAKGIIHRDLKPDNLFYARTLNSGRFEELIKVVDFGIAKMLWDDGQQMNAVETQAGTVFGTPRYMSPEQAQGRPLDPRSDLYSLGVILYHMLTGRPPFTDDDAIVVMARHIKTMPRPPSEVCPEARIPPELEYVVMRTLSKEPEQRPATADALAQELTSACEAAVASTSGVRASFPVGMERTLALPPTPPASVRPPPPPPVVDDTLSPPRVVEVAPEPHRGPLILLFVFLATLVLGALGAGYVLFARPSAPSTESLPPQGPPLAVETTTVPGRLPDPPPPPPAETGKSPPTFNISQLPVAPPPSASTTKGRPWKGNTAPSKPASPTVAPTSTGPYERFE